MIDRLIGWSFSFSLQNTAFYHVAKNNYHTTSSPSTQRSGALHLQCIASSTRKRIQLFHGDVLPHNFDCISRVFVFEDCYKSPLDVRHFHLHQSLSLHSQDYNHNNYLIYNPNNVPLVIEICRSRLRCSCDAIDCRTHTYQAVCSLLRDR